MIGIILTKPMIVFLRLILIEVFLLLFLYSFNLVSFINDKKSLNQLSSDIKRKLSKETSFFNINELSAEVYLKKYRKRLIDNSVKWLIFWLIVVCSIVFFELVLTPKIHNNIFLLLIILYGPFFIYYLIILIVSFFCDKELYEVLAYCDHDNYYYDGKGNETARRITVFFYDFNRMIFRTKKVRISRSIPINDNNYLYLVVKNNGKRLQITDISNK